MCWKAQGVPIILMKAPACSSLGSSEWDAMRRETQRTLCLPVTLKQSMRVLNCAD